MENNIPIKNYLIAIFIVAVTIFVTFLLADIYNTKKQYVLLPVWMLNVKYKDKIHTIAMNGQTGKMVGNVPIDKGAYMRHHIKWTLIIGVILFVIALIFL